jgi:hypothetical protein
MRSIIRGFGALALVGASALAGCGPGADRPALTEALAETLADHLARHGLPPEDYLLDKLRDHDVVILGEFHRVRQEVELIQRMIGRMDEAGFRFLCTEFGRREDQARIDRLITAPEWDEALARSIGFDQFVFWGYREYLDVYRAAWRVNRDHAADRPPFRILGMNDSPDWSHVRTPEDRDDPAVMRRVWRGGGEKHWARVVLDSVVARGEKALVYCGYNHAMSRYRQPVADAEGNLLRYNEDRVGRYLHEALGDRVMTVFTHFPWPAPGYRGWVLAADGCIDALMGQAAPPAYPVGFDVPGTPFASLPGTTSFWATGYEDFRLETLVDGYVFLAPLGELEGVEPIEGWFNEENLETARRQSPNPDHRDATVEELTAALVGDADVPRRLRRLR